MTHPVHNALQHCEAQLRGLASKAAAEGSYDLLARIGSTARSVSDLAREWEPVAAASKAMPPAPESGQDPASVASSRPRAGGASSSRAYPRFLRQGDDLVKIGWSKSDRKEYQHRAAHSVLVALRQSLLESSKRKKLFTMDPLSRQLSTTGAPGYQAYVWLAWLRAVGLVQQHGRQGYTVSKPVTFEQDLEQAFAGMPTQVR